MTVIASLIVFYLTQSKPNIVYILSEGIPAVGKSQTENTIQQVEVKNNGSKEDKNIRVKITSKVKNFKIIEHSKSIKYKVYDDDSNFELVYPILPPDASFKVVFESSKVSDESLKVQTDRGNAENALTEKDPFLNNVWYGFIILYGIMSLWSSRNLLLTKWEFKSINFSEEVLAVKKPWYVGNSKWLLSRKTAIRHFLYRDNRPFSKDVDLAQTNSYKFLNKGLEYITEEEYEEFSKVAKSSFMRLFYAQVNSIEKHTYILTCLQLEKPINFSDDDWQSLNSIASAAYIRNRLSEISFSLNKEKLESMQEEERPINLDEKAWFLFTECTRVMYFYMLIVDVMTSNNIETIKNYNLTLVDEDKRQLIEQMTRLTIQMKICDFSNIESLKKTLELEDVSLLTVEELQGIKKNIKQYLSLEEARTEAEKKLEDIKDLKKELIKDKDTLFYTQTQITRQLKFISEFIDNPSVIDNIEDYDTLFAPGNMNNLRKISDILKEKPST